MEGYYERFYMEIKTLAPVFIGSGKSVNKKEYYYDRNNNRISIFDMRNMFQVMNQKRLLPAYEEYLLKSNGDFFLFMKDNNLRFNDIKKWISYTIPVSDTGMITRKTSEIQTFMKDPYGKPYVPGSSLKGALRTILQGTHYQNNPEVAESIAKSIKIEKFFNNKKRYMSSQNEEMSIDAFHRNIFPESALKNMANDSLRGLIISDSEPLNLMDLCVCQKVDISTTGTPNKLNLLRECIQPGVIIRFTVSIDTKACPFSWADIKQAIKDFYENYKSEYLIRFSKAPKTNGNSITFFLGGGAGYVSKTNVYNLMHGQEAVETAGRIINSTVNKKDQKRHGHLDDWRNHRISPHMLKCTIYNTDLMQFGACCVTRIKHF